MPITITLPPFSAFSWQNGYPADYVAPEEIETLVRYKVLRPNGSLIAIGDIGEGDDATDVTDQQTQPGCYIVTFQARHVHPFGQSLSSNVIFASYAKPHWDIDSLLRPLAGTGNFPQDLGANGFRFNGGTSYFMMSDVEPGPDRFGSIIRSGTWTLTLLLFVGLNRGRPVAFWNNDVYYPVLALDKDEFFYDRQGTAPITVPFRTWTRITITSEETVPGQQREVRLYFNQTLIGTWTNDDDLQPLTSDRMAFGRNGVSAARYFPGRMRQIRLYEQALSPSDVNNLSNGTEPQC